MYLIFLLMHYILASFAVSVCYALIEVDTSGTVAERSYIDPDLSPDIFEENAEASFLAFTQTNAVSEEAQNILQHAEDNLGLVPGSAQIDVRSGRVASLTLAEPLLPGTGYGNRFLWSVTAGNVGDKRESPKTVQEWERLAIKAFKNWMVSNAAVLNINAKTELFSKGSVRVAVHEDGDMIQLHLPRKFKGLTVVGARAMATIKLGNLISVGLEDWGTIPSNFSANPQLSAEDAYNALSLHAGRSLKTGSNCNDELQILTLTPPVAGEQLGGGYEYALAWRVCPIFEGQQHEVMEGFVNAQTGKVHSFIDKVHYFQARGDVYPISNDKRVPDGLLQPDWPMPFMSVGNETTDTGGNYMSSGSLTASFNGQYVIINDNCGSASLTQSNQIDWGGSTGDDCTTPGFGGNGNTHSARTNFYQLNKVMEIARSHLPNNSWLKKKLTVNVNINNSCNAYWSNTINFYRSGGNCGNTGELAGVIIHEWGHGLDDNDVTGSIAQPSGEGIADIYAALTMGDSCIGRGFFTSGSGCTGVRDVDYKAVSPFTPQTFTLSNKNCGGAEHCIGKTYSQAIWSLFKRILQEAPYNYDANTALEVTARLTYIAAGNVGAWFSGSPPYGGCGTASGYREFLAADDDNGNINDGTPHMKAIFKAFNDQEIACNTPVAQDSGCSGKPVIAPTVTVVPGDMLASISWTAVNGASNYQVFRTEGVKGCGMGKVLLKTTSTLSFTDTGLMNGRKYYYIVIPKGQQSSCFGPASNCSEVIPTVEIKTSEPSNVPTQSPSKRPITLSPSAKPVTSLPTKMPSTKAPTKKPITPLPTINVTILQPTPIPQSIKPSQILSNSPTTNKQTSKPTLLPVTSIPSKKPSSIPSNTCGNDVCEINETATSCAIDCDNVVLVTHNAGSNGATGVMFYVKARRDISVTSFTFYTNGIKKDLVEVYTRAGLYNGYELNPDGWTKVYSKTITQMGKDTPTVLEDFTSGVNIPSGTFQSFYIYTPVVIIYDKGIKEGNLFSADESIEYYEGIGISTKFPGASGNYSSMVYTPRVMKGAIRYDAVRFTSIPTRTPTNLPTKKNPTSRPSKLPSRKPVTSSPSKKPTTQIPTNKPFLTKLPTEQPITSSPTISFHSPTMSPFGLVPSEQPSKSPSYSCGNNICEIQETATTCSQDCDNKIFITHNAGVNGASGVMFYIKARRDIIVTSFNFYTNVVKEDTVEVFTRSGLYKGFELSQAGWASIYSKSVSQKGQSELSVLGEFDSGVIIPKDSFQSFYIYTPQVIIYDKGTAEGNLFSADESLEFFEGAGITSKFPESLGNYSEMVFSPRVLKGEIKYYAITLSNSAT